MPTFMAKKGSVKPTWHLVDAKGQILGRMAVKIATLLMGKHRPNYTPHVETGDGVVLINAKDVKLTGKKLTDKLYRRHSSYPGGFKQVPAGVMLATRPTEVVRLAVKRMLPKNKLASKMLKRLRIYAGPDHRNQAQKPQPLEL